jgi:hypothetical protein
MKIDYDLCLGIIVWLVLCFMSYLGGYFYGYHQGKVGTYQSFQSKECWIGPESNDVICSIYVE